MFRLNFSHGTHDDHRAAVRRDPAVEAEPAGRSASSPTCRDRSCGSANSPAAGSSSPPARISASTSTEPGDTSRAPLPHPEIFAALAPGTDLLLDDGKVRLQRHRCGADFAETRVVVGGTLVGPQGRQRPGAVLPISAMTAKDRADLAFALEHGVDCIALSFVQRPEESPRRAS